MTSRQENLIRLPATRGSRKKREMNSQYSGKKYLPGKKQRYKAKMGFRWSWQKEGEMSGKNGAERRAHWRPG